ncbi:TPA: hypothetical protein DEG20_01395 [candidate division WWE3 bacterium]|nr:MAG: hypothetical protein A2245_02615 [candidate division WWE3 bacterium RIFOXYA2_FULL_43_12]OGC73322.1 MAG: hypothetical protein A2337_03200 [candidate division WWE3 bacterium RIFOXYB2_FULL_43_9]HBY09894.1 hypothetical protein [candidate division WWE3 bacterium]
MYEKSVPNIKEETMGKSSGERKGYFLEKTKVARLLPKGFRLRWVPGDSDVPADIVWLRGGPQDIDLIQKNVGDRWYKRTWETVGYLHTFFGFVMDGAIFLYEQDAKELRGVFEEIAEKLGIRVVVKI